MSQSLNQVQPPSDHKSEGFVLGVYPTLAEEIGLNPVQDRFDTVHPHQTNEEIRR